MHPFIFDEGSEQHCLEQHIIHKATTAPVYHHAIMSKHSRKCSRTPRKAIRSPHRCFLAEVPSILNDTVGYPDRSCLRLLGIAVSLTALTTVSSTTPSRLVVDDGTGLVELTVSAHMTARLNATATVLEGLTVECIGAIHPSSPTSNPPKPRSLYVQQLAIVEDVNAETLRWLELSFRQSQNKGSEYHCEYGYPTRAVNSNDLLEIIQLDASTTDSNTSSNQRKKKCYARGNRSKSIPTAPPKPRGVALEDLAAFFQLPVGTAQEFLEDLQLGGLVYRNQEGLYLPL